MDEDVSDLFKRVRRLQLISRGLVREMLGGAYVSCFKGQGMDFDDFRQYEQGDETRYIDWNVTARQGEPFVKQFVEERELGVYFVIDVSGSSEFGSSELTKREFIAEIAAALAFSALRQQDKIGLVLFSNKVDSMLPAKKGQAHVVQILREILSYKGSPGFTKIAPALQRIVQSVPRRSLVFLISDFIAEDFQAAIKAASRLHDLIAIQIFDPVEDRLPQVGRVRLHDPETDRQLVLDTSRSELRQRYRKERISWQNKLDSACNRYGIDKLKLSVSQPYMAKMHAFLKNRAQHERR